MITLKSSFEELYSKHQISMRLVNGCKRLGFNCLGDVYKYQQEHGGASSLFRLRGLGSVSIKELQSLINENVLYKSKVLEENLKDISLICSPIFDDLLSDSDIFRTIFPNVSSFCTSISDMESLPLMLESDLIPKQKIVIWDKIIALLERFCCLDSLKVYDFYYKHIQNLYFKCVSDYEKYKFLVLFNYYEDFSLVACVLRLKYKSLLEESDFRTKKTLQKYFPTCRDFVRFYYDEDNIRIELFSGCGKKTIDIISGVVHEFYDFASEILFADDLCEILQKKIEIFSLDEIQFVNDFYQSHNHLPILFLSYKYLCSSKEKTDVLYRQYYGIGCQNKSMQLLGTNFNLSSERIRQILTTKDQTKFYELDIVSELQHYSFCDNLYINLCSKKCEECKKEEHLEHLTNRAFGALICLISNFAPLNFNSDTFVVSRKIIQKFNLIAILKNIKPYFSKKYSSNTLIPLIPLIVKYEKEPIAEDKGFYLKNIIDFIKLVFNVDIDLQGNMILCQNIIDLDRELYIIIKENGKPMEIEQIFSQFKKKYPYYKFSEPLQLKRILDSSLLIRPIRNQLVYSIKDWDDIVFTGSIRDYAYEILKNHENPLHIDVLCELVKKQFPKTSRKSLNASILSDERHGFIKTEKGLIVLKK